MENTSGAGFAHNELHMMQMEIKSLQDDVRVLREALLASNQEKAALEKKLELFKEQVLAARRKMFGASSEQIDNQINLFNEAESEADPHAEEPTPETIVATPHKQRKTPEFQRASMDESLPTEVVEHEAAETDCTCPNCQGVMEILTFRESTELAFTPAVLKRIIHRFPVLSCPDCKINGIQSTILETKRPEALLPKTMASPSIIARIITQKYMMALPLYRQEMEWEQLGIHLTRQTQSNWLLALSERYIIPMCERMRHHLLLQDILHADETTLQVLKEPDRPAESKSYMWVYMSGRYGPPIIRYDYRTTRAAKHPKAFLSGYKGFLHTDGYAGYHDLPGITVAGCWSHARRYFFDAIKILPVTKRTADLPSMEGLSFCDQLFAIEHMLQNETPEVRFAERLNLCPPILDAFYTWLKEMKPKVIKESLFGKAVNYCLNQWPYLTTFLKDGRLEIQNNRAERTIKNFVIGRKNWLFSNTPKGANASAAIYSLVITAKSNGLRVEAYLRWLFERIPNVDIKDDDVLDFLMPWSPAVPDECRMSPAEKDAAEKE